jgi:hypothetical protein
MAAFLSTQTSGKGDFDLIFRPLAPGFSVHCKRSQPLNMTASMARGV